MKLAIPIAYVEPANRLAAIIDPDSGGAQTFHVLASADGNEPATHYIADGLIQPEYEAVILTRDSNEYMTALTPLAEERGRDLPLLADCEAFAEHAEFDEEVTVIPVQTEPE